MTHPTPLTSPQERTVVSRTICIEVRYSDKMTEVILIGEDDESMAEMAAMGWRRVAAAKAEPVGPMLAATLGDKVAFERAIEAEMGARTNPDDGRIDTTVHGEPVFGARPPGELGEIKLNGDGFIRFAGDTSRLVLQPGPDVLKFGAGEMNGHAVAQSQALDGFPLHASVLVMNQSDEARNGVEPRMEPPGKLFSERVASLLRERNCFTYEFGHHPVTQAVLDVLDEKFGKTF